MGAIYKHNLRARREGKAIIVETPDGRPVRVGFASTEDMRTCYAYVKGLGFIGGFQVLPLATIRYEKKVNGKAPWDLLFDSINAGYVYHDMNDLPGRKNAKKRERNFVPITQGCPASEIIDKEEKNA